MKKHIAISKLLIDLYENPEFQNNLTIGKLIDLLHEHAYGIGILIFALPSILPCAAIPGVSLLFGLPLVLLSLQLVFFQEKPWFPQWLRVKKINSTTFTRYLKQAIPHVIRFEKVVRPRFIFLNSRFMRAIQGIVLLLLSVLLVLPIPFSNMPLGTLIAIIALGFIESDGLVLFISFIVSIFTIIFFSEVIDWLIIWITQFFSS